jgi:hypothetical protein
MQLGDICGQWSHLEGKLAGLLAVLLLTRGLILDEIFEHIRETSQKRTVLITMAKRTVGNTADRKALLELLNEYQQLAGERSRYVHARWLVEDALYPDRLIWVRRVNPNWSKEVELVSEKRLANVARKIVELRKKLDALVDEAFIDRLKATQLKRTTPSKPKAK